MAEKIFRLKSGAVVAANDFGNPAGKVIVINHGMIASIADEDLFRKLIDSGYRCIAVARPGYGRSSTYELADIGEWGKLVGEVMDVLDVNEYSVFGSSSGATYAYGIACADNRVRNVYVLSGTPALYDDEIQKMWPYPLNDTASIPELQALAKKLFFGDSFVPDVKNRAMDDSFANNCFGIALDLYLRIRDWGFRLEDIGNRCFIEHTLNDSSVPLACAKKTAGMLNNAEFSIRKDADHFSEEILNDFIEDVIVREEL